MVKSKEDKLRIVFYCTDGMSRCAERKKVMNRITVGESTNHGDGKGIKK